MTKEITNAIGKMQVLKNHTPVMANVSTIFNWECDVFSVNRGGYTYEFEVKISRSDFLRDKKKKKWTCAYSIMEENTPNYMSYVCPEGLIKLEEIGEFSGLYYFKDGSITEVRGPSLRHKFKKDINEIQFKIARLYSQREFLGCSLLTHENKEIRERNKRREDEQKESNRKWAEHMAEMKTKRELNKPIN